MKILAIETSCDDTGISIIEAKGSTTNASFKVLANNISSQIKIHIPYGGVFPALAKREHIKNLPIILGKTLSESGLNKKKKPVDIIAVTYGPGLEPALWTGITFAQELSKKWNVPVVPVNHMEGHIFSVFIKNKKKFKISLQNKKQVKIKYPILSLLVSGGHTELVLTKKIMDYKIIGQTLDDAVGEAFDKVARMLGLPYPGGPEISKLAEKIRTKENKALRGRNFSTEKFAQSSGRRLAESPQNLFSFSLPRPMLHSKNFDFSFSGLKTAVLYLIRDLEKVKKLNKKTKAKIALEFENAAVECLVHKTNKAIKQFKIKTLIVAGGVSANEHLKKEIEKMNIKTYNKKTRILFPGKDHSGDNSLMVGIAGYLNYIKNKKKTIRAENITAIGNLRL